MFDKSIFTIFLLALLFFSCDSKPKIIVEDQATSSVETIGEAATATQGVAPVQSAIDVHQVVTKDILQGERYTYMQVLEGERTYWLATAKIEAEKGKTYLYRGGLLKTNFKSEEFKRNFDTLYLVSHIIDAAQHPGGNLNTAAGENTSDTPVSSDISVLAPKDAIKLSDLFANKQKYDGKIITVAGKSVKVNNGIMGKNWVHIQDGSKAGGKNLDLTITTGLTIPLGATVALQGKIILNKDFGSGYRYDILMEDATGIK